MCHYRRFFSLHENMAFCESIPKPESFIKDFRYNPQEIINILESGRMIVTKRLSFISSAMLQYCECHVSEYYRILKTVLHDNFPDYYDTFVKVMETNNKLSARSIFIMKWEDFEEWCAFIFPVMKILEDKIPSQYHQGTGQARTLAFLAERLFYVWQVKNKKKQKFCTLYMPDDNLYSKSKTVKPRSYIRNMFSHIRVNTAINLLYLPDKIRSFLRRK